VVSQSDKKRSLHESLGDNAVLGGLFFALLFFLMSYPLITHRAFGSLLLDVIFSVMLVASAYAVSNQRKVLIVAIILALPAFGFWWAVRATDAPATIFAGLALSVVFFLFIIFVLLRNIVRSEYVSVGTIFGVMSVYLLIGVAWSFVYAMVELATPGAFDFGVLAAQLDSSATHGELRFLGYYSLVTLSTLGYGDITPVSPLARSLSALEAVAGQLYIAVLIAFMVGTHIAQKRRD
jgi:voltage-gated potassium channel